MNYLSTRDKSLNFNFKDIFLRGLAPDGGLFLPSEIRHYNKSELENLRKLSYSDLAVEILLNFCSDNLSKDELKSLIQDAYKNFEDKEVVRIKKIGNINLLELYHGPTLAFKDIAMQVIGNMYDQLKVAEKKTICRNNRNSLLDSYAKPAQSSEEQRTPDLTRQDHTN